MKRLLEPNTPIALSVPACWQREAPCACLRVELTSCEAHLFPYQQLVTASLLIVDNAETLRLTFATHEVELTGRNLRDLFHGLQDFAVKWVRPVPSRYQATTGGDSGFVQNVRVTELS